MFVTARKYFPHKFAFPAIMLFAVLVFVAPCLVWIAGTASFGDFRGIRDEAKGSLKVVCYYNFPRDDGDLQPEDVPSDLCTHINIAFAGVNPKNYSISVSESDSKIVRRLAFLKEKNNELKFIISAGGSGNTAFRPMVKNHRNRKLFVNSTMRLIKRFELDGVDIDWEWPGDNGDAVEKVKFIQLLREFRQEFDRHKKCYIISVAVGSLESQVKMSYYVNYMNQYVDFVNLMTYDYHFFTYYYPLTDYNAPLYASAKDENALSAFLNVNYSVNYWIEASMPREKIVLGLAAFGHTYRLISSLNHNLHSPANGIGSVGADGYILYPEVCNFTKLLNTFTVFDDEAKVPYAYNQYDWISYDDEMSMYFKASYIVDNNLGGAMIYSLNAEDHRGECKENVTYPLIRKVLSVLSDVSKR